MPKFLRGKEMAQILGISYYTLMAWAEQGLLPSYKVGRCRRFDPEEVINFIKTGEMERLLEGDMRGSQKKSVEDKK